MSKKRLIWLIVLILVFLAAISLYKNYNKENPKKVEPGKNDFSVINFIWQESESVDTDNPLGKKVEEALMGTKGKYAVAIKNLETGESYYKNEHRSYLAGSLYKLWIMAEVVNKLETGELKEDEVLSAEISTLNKKFNIASEDAELTEGSITLTVKSALEQMITISHNYAALLLTERVKLATIKSFVKDHGFNDSLISQNPPITTAWDIAFFLEKLYKGEFGNENSTARMINLLKKQQLNDKLPRYLPKGTVIVHKTGELDYFSHDAGIVYSKSGDYIITVLSESDMPSAAEDRISQISKNVYEYFTK